MHSNDKYTSKVILSIRMVNRFSFALSCIQIELYPVRGLDDTLKKKLILSSINATRNFTISAVFFYF